PCLASRLDNSEKVQATLNAYTQAALTYAVRIRGTCAIGIITNKRYKATTIPSPIDSHFIFSLLNVPMRFAYRRPFKGTPLYALSRTHLHTGSRSTVFPLG